MLIVLNSKILMSLVAKNAGIAVILPESILKLRIYNKGALTS